MYECSCGFSAGTAIAFQKHLSKADLLEDHRLVHSDGKQQHKSSKKQQPQLSAEPAAAVTHRTLSPTVSSITDQQPSMAQALAGGLVTPMAHMGVDSTDLTEAWEAVSKWTDDVDITPLPLPLSARIEELASDYTTPVAASSPPLDPSESPPVSTSNTPRHRQLPPHPPVDSSMAVRWSGAFFRTISGATRRLTSYGQELQRTPSASEVIRRQSQDGHADWAAAVGQDPLQLVGQMEAVLVWRDAWLTTKVFGAGLYLLICVQQLSSGFGLVQPTTLLCSAALLYMLFNFLRQAWRRRRELLHPHQAQPQEKPVSEQEIELLQRVTLAVANMGGMAAPYIAAAAVLAARRLSGRRFRSTVWLGLLLYLGAWVGELQLLSQGSMLIAAWLLLFSFPWLYVQCQRAMDSMVEEALATAVQLLYQGNRTSLLLALGSAAAVLSWTPLGLLSRLALSLTSAFAVLAWQAHMANAP